MSYAVMEQMLDIDWGNDGLFRMAMILADYADGQGRGIWPSVETLAKRVYRDRRTVQRHLKRLRDAGVIFEVASNVKSVMYHINMHIVRLLRRGVVSFEELVCGRVEVPREDEPQMVLPGMEAQGGSSPHCAPVATAMSSTGDSNVTQTGHNKNIPGAGRFEVELREKMIEAAGEAVDPDHAHGLRDISEALMWIENGADIDLDILPVIASRSRGKGAAEVYSWKYYRRAVLAALARRKTVVDLDDYRRRKTMSGGAGDGVKARSGEDTDAIWQRNYRIAVETYRASGWWDDQFGPCPDDDDIRAVCA